MTTLEGTSVGNWRVGRLLGEGAFGAVYEGEHSAIAGRYAAVKVLHPHLSMQQSLKQRFLNEANAASLANHDNIAQIYDAGITPDGICYMVMEMLRGQTLKSALERGALDVDRAVEIGVQIAGGLQAAHERQIVHRDLKPDNVFLVARAGTDDFVKILDFGVCKLRGDVQGNKNLTSTGMIIGTSAYMSPEQWMTKPDIDGRADIYALGVILFECLSGHTPFSGQSAYEYMFKHLEEAPPALAQPGQGHQIMPRLAQAVQKMLSKEPNRRQQSMREVIRDLRLCVDAPAVPQPQPQIQPRDSYSARTEVSPPSRPPQPAPIAAPAPVMSPTPPPMMPAARPVQAAGDWNPLEDRRIQFLLTVVVALGLSVYAYFHWPETVNYLKSQMPF